MSTRLATPVLRSHTAQTVAVFVAALAILVLRRPETVTNPQFVYEDGMFYLDARTAGIGSLPWPYAGYLQLFPRAIALLETLVPTADAPLLGAGITLGLISCLAVAAFRVWPPLVLAVVLLPEVAVEIGSPTLLQFYLAIGLLIGLVAMRLRWPSLVLLAACAIAGPFSILLVPLFAVRAWRFRDRDSIARLIAVAAPALIQAIVLGLNPRHDVAAAVTSVDWLVVGAGHLTAAVLGSRFMLIAATIGPEWFVAVLVAVTVGVVLLVARTAPIRVRYVIGYLVVVSTAAAIFGGSADRDHLLSPVSVPRYFHLVGAAIAALAMLALRRRSVWAMVLVGFVVFGWVGDFRPEELPPSPWATGSQCLSTPGPCVVPVWPGGKWDVRWVEP